MRDRVLIDSSVWIEFFRKKDAALIGKIAALLETQKAAYTGIIALELINGAKSPKELQALHDAFDTMEKIDEREQTYFSAGGIGYELARKGHTLGVVDLLIAQVAIENNIALMTFDEHFKVIAKYSSLKLF